jgi:hypothetical protein
MPINKIALPGVTVGANATSYQPPAPVARDEMAWFLARTMNLSAARRRRPVKDGLKGLLLSDPDTATMGP